MKERERQRGGGGMLLTVLFWRQSVHFAGVTLRPQIVTNTSNWNASVPPNKPPWPCVLRATYMQYLHADFVANIYAFVTYVL